jgi:hypothetical protein
MPVPCIGVRKNGSSSGMLYHAAAAPSAAPANAISDDSVRYWRTRRSDPAPIDVLTANSC